MMMKKNVVAIGVFALLTTVGCAHKPSKVSEANLKESEGHYVTNAAAVEAEANTFVEIDFKQGSASLSNNAKSSLTGIIQESRQDAQADEVIILSWSDEELPSKNLSELSKAQRELANKRNANVEQYVKSMKDVKVKTYNMAERPSAFSKLFNTADSKLKNSMLSAGLSTTADNNFFVNKASHSVILMKIK
jgi:ABC-type multidrug transport system fused ATPase/permease subunit